MAAANVTSGPGMTVGTVTIQTERSRTQKASERVAQEIVRDIVRRGLSSGDHLPLEAEMVEEYHVSRTSLREALRLLEVQGLLSLKPGPGGGPTVGTVEPAFLARTTALYFHLSGAKYSDVMRTQVLMEGICARLAAQNPERERAMRPWFGLDMPDDVASYRNITLGFHGAVYELTGNPVLSLLTQAVTHIVTQHVIMTMDPVDLRPAIVDEHGTLAELIASGDADEAERQMAAHFQTQHDHFAVRSPARLEEIIEWR